MVLPIIGLVLAAASTAASISAQNRAVAQQNAAISAQISANKQQEEMRQADVAFQRRILAQQFAQEQAGRRQAYRETQQQYDVLSAQVEAEREVTKAQLEAQTELYRRQSSIADRTIQQQDNDLRNERQAGLSSLQKDLANAPRAEIQALPNLKASQAQMLAAGVGVKGETSKNMAKPIAAFRQALEQVRNSREMTAAIEQQLNEYQQWMDLANRGSDIQVGVDRATLASERNFANSQSAAEIGTRDAIANEAQRNIVNQRGMSALAAGVDRRNAYVNMLLRKGQLNTGSALSQAQAALQQSQLYAQRAAYVNPISAVAAFGQQALPLVAQMTSNPKTSQPAQRGWRDAVNNVVNIPRTTTPSTPRVYDNSVTPIQPVPSTQRLSTPVLQQSVVQQTPVYNPAQPPPSSNTYWMNPRGGYDLPEAPGSIYQYAVPRILRR